jgi:hypothetical protein
VAAESKDAAILCLEARRRGRRAVPEVCGKASHTSSGQAFLQWMSCCGQPYRLAALLVLQRSSSKPMKATVL